MDKLGVEVDAFVIPVGGGGLLAGMATVIKHVSPQVEVIVSRVEYMYMYSQEPPSYPA